MSFHILIRDNFHYMDQDEQYEYGSFATAEAAIEAARRIVDEYLLSAHRPGMTSEQLFTSYTTFGEDPVVVGGEEEVAFSAWEYAKHRCHELCAASENSPADGPLLAGPRSAASPAAVADTRCTAGPLGLPGMGMQMSTLPLSQIHPSWRGSIIPSAFEALTRGIERERMRLFGVSFLTLTFRKEFDIDGVTEYLELLEGFADEANAMHYVEQLTAQALSASLAESSKWHRDVSRDNERFKANHESSLVRCLHLKSFKVLDGSGFNSKYFQFEVLRMNHSAVLGPDLFTYFDAEAEWMDYFISKGKE